MGKFTSGPVLEYDPKVLEATQLVRLDVTEIQGKERT